MQFSAGIRFTALPRRSLLRHRQDGKTSDRHKKPICLKTMTNDLGQTNNKFRL